MAETIAQRIERHEGRRYLSYDDSEGTRTVGVGFNLEKRGAKRRIERLGYDYRAVFEGRVVMSDAAIDILRDDDIAEATSLARHRFPDLDTMDLAQVGTIVDMIYNLGLGKFLGFKKMNAAIDAGSDSGDERDFQRASNEIIASKYATQVGARAVENAAAFGKVRPRARAEPQLKPTKLRVKAEPQLKPAVPATPLPAAPVRVASEPEQKPTKAVKPPTIGVR